MVFKKIIFQNRYVALYYVKSILTEISASRQDRRVLQKSKIIRIEFLSKWGMLQTSRYVQNSRNLEKTILTEISQCTAALYSDWSLQMGQMGPKMTLGTLKMNGNDFPGVQGVLRGSNSVHDLISYIYWRQSDTVYCSRKGGRQRGKGWSKSFFLENKVVVNFNFRHGAKKSGQLGHPFRSYGSLSIQQRKSKMKEFTNVAGRVTSFAGRVNFFCPSWISCPGA